jgi:hypothetical protein
VRCVYTHSIAISRRRADLRKICALTCGRRH